MAESREKSLVPGGIKEDRVRTFNKNFSMKKTLLRPGGGVSGEKPRVTNG